MMTCKTIKPAAIALAVSLAFVGQAAAQDTMSEGMQANTPTTIAAWSYDPIYDQGFSVEALLDAEVYDVEGNDIGEVENLVVAGNGDHVTGLIIETGGFLEIGDTHLVYPFDEARIQSTDAVHVNIDGENVEEFTLFDGVEGEPIDGANWRITDIIGDYAYATDNAVGWIEDVAIDSSGEILAVIVQPDVTYHDWNQYAWPYAGYEPERGYYQAPYESDELFELDPFASDELYGAL